MSSPASPTEKRRWPRELAGRVADELAARLRPVCSKLEIAGSYRRGKATVGDIELVYVPQFTSVPAAQPDMFSQVAPTPVNLADRVLDQLLEEGVLCRRPNVRGSFAWGPSNKLALHAETMLPVDLFAARWETFANYLVCRTGPKESNMAISMAAQAKGWQWHPYSIGFTDHKGRPVKVLTEADAFTLVGLEYKRPEER